jgi:molybdopterin-containing oxidoreductase family membrane subunit
MVLLVLAVPVLTFESWATYMPSWQEVATTILPVAYGVILISLSYRYLPIFPQERELNPIEGSETDAVVAEAVEAESAGEAPEGDGDAEMQPAES